MKFRLLLFLISFYSIQCLAQRIPTHYEIYGSGEPLLLINGGPGFSSEGFRPLAKELASRTNHKVIIYDQRATGKSALEHFEVQEITMDLMVADIEQLRKHLNIKNWVVMGHSFGGIMAFYYTSKHPNRVNGLIQSSSGGMDLMLLSGFNIASRLTALERDSLNYYTNLYNSGERSDYIRLKRAQYLAPAYLYDKKHIDAIADRLTQGNMEINRLVWADLRSIGYDVKDELKDFKKPVLLLHGDDDVVPLAIARKAEAHFEAAKLVIIGDCSHYGWLEQPEIYYRNIVSFLENNS